MIAGAQHPARCCGCSRAVVKRGSCRSSRGCQTAASIPFRLIGHSHAAQKQQRPSRAARCSESGSGAADHSGHDSGHDVHDSGHHSSSSSSFSRDSSADSGNHHDAQAFSSNAKKDSRNDHETGNSDEDTFLNDSILDIASMFDTTETGNTGIEYRPSSGSYSDAPSQSTNPDFWAHKPVWCQPWSILASGITFVAVARWITGGSTVATVVAAVPILVWWYLFLVLVPADFREYAEK
ncbi:hypothetical protein ABBQ38_005890 [Trebouxia sp. C0009 RCD-2024]